MAPQLRHGTPSPISTRSAARRRYYRHRFLRALRLIFGALIFCIIFTGLFHYPVFDPRQPEVIAQQPTATLVPTSTATTAPTNTATATAAPPASTATPAVLPIATLPSEAFVSAYGGDSPILYYAQSGDSLDILSIRFGVEVEKISSSEPIPEKGLITPGQLLLIPSRLETTSATQKLMPDSEVINSPSVLGFDLEGFVQAAGGYLASYDEYVMNYGRLRGAEIIAVVARDYAINPRLLLTILQLKSNWVYGQPPNQTAEDYPMGVVDVYRKGLHKQCISVAGDLLEGYYGWREGRLIAINFGGVSQLRLAPELNAGTVSLLHYFARILPPAEWAELLYGEDNFTSLHDRMFGSAWIRAQGVEPLMPEGTQQPEMILPFQKGYKWSFTGGPHAAWGVADVRGALDFAPPSAASGCLESFLWVLSTTPGLVVRAHNGAVVVDVDGDGNEQTGWNVIYMHIATKDRVDVGSVLTTEDRIGHPSCEGGTATGTHLHIVRKFNGEWVAADGPLPFTLDGWVAKAGAQPYKGWLMKADRIIYANATSPGEAHIWREE